MHLTPKLQKNKAIAYLRISTTEQDLKRQETEIEAFAEKKNFDLVDTFTDTISASQTKKSDRKGFVEMEDFLDKNNDVKHILIIEISRLGRKQLEILNTIEKYFLKGVNIHIKDLGISTIDENGLKPFGTELMISLLSSMAQNETRLLSERIKSGKMQRARDGFAFSAKTTGYKKDLVGKPIIDEKVAPIVRRIFELASNGTGMRGISDIILDEFNKKMQMGTIGGILRNPFYKGERKYNNINIDVDAIVSKEVWDKANKSIDSRKHFASRRYVHPNIIQGKNFCGICKNPMYQVVILSNRSNMYRCKDAKCGNSINRPWLQEVIRQVAEVYAKKTRDKTVKKQIKDEIKVINSQLSNAHKAIESKRQTRTSLTLHFASGKIENDNYDNALNMVSSDIEKIEKELPYLKQRKISLETSLNNSIEHFSSDLNLLKKQIKDILISVIVFKNDVEINLSFSTITIDKPNSGKLGWLTREAKKNNKFGNLLPNAHLINSEELEQIKINVDSLDVTDEVLETYFESEEYKAKIEGVESIKNKI